VVPDPGRRASRPATWALVITCLLLLAVGFVLANDYGMSVDEHANAVAGAAALQVYRGEPDAYFSQGEVLAHHGPAYFMLFSVSSRLLAAIVPGWVAADGRHLTNFLTFLASVGALFVLVRRWLRPGAAWLTTALFFTQPLLFGYGFVNQKDTPFMAAFVLIVAGGMAIADRLTQSTGQSAESGGAGAQLRRDWSRLKPVRRGLLLGLLVLVAVLLLDLWTIGWGARGLRSATIAAYKGGGGPLLARVFAQVAAHPQDVPVEAYLAKLDANYDLALIPISLGLVAIVLVALRAAFPLSSRQFVMRHGSWLLPVLLGALVGFAVSIRPIGGFAGALASLFWILRLRRRSWLPLLALWLSAALVAYLTWPFLWADPIGNLLRSLQLTATFPPHDMLYRGAMVSSDALPWHFFPTLGAIQLTEPVSLLVLVGLGVLVARLARRRFPWDEALLLGVWIGVPLAGLLFLGFGIYGNIRQLLFVLPPLFVIAGIALDAIFGAVRVRWARGITAAVVLLPGVVGIVRMHPYEHAYFNELVGGVDGAWGEYQPSHWCTSLREAAGYVNQVAPAGALVLVDGPVEGVRAFARQDLMIEGVWSELPDPAFLIACTRTPEELQELPGMRTVYQVGRGQAVYAEVLQANGP
jgi:hypothetical protein